MSDKYATYISLKQFGDENKLPIKTAHTLDRVFSEIKSNTFDQGSIELMLINSRDFFPSNSIIEEIANFIAHPLRDRGFISSDVEKQLELISTSFDIRLDKNGNIILPTPWYERVKKYYRDIKPNKKMLNKVNNIFKKENDEYISQGVMSGYTRERIAEAVGGEEIPKSSIHEKHILDSIDNFLSDLEISEKEFSQETKEEIIVCIMSLLHGCEFKSNYGGSSLCFLGFDEDKNLQLRANLDPYGYAEKEAKGYEGELASYSVIETNIDKNKYINYNIESHYIENTLIENGVNPIYASRNKDTGELIIQRYKIFDIEEMKIADTGM